MRTVHDLDRRQQRRTARATVTLSHNGLSVSGQDIVVAQRVHKFLFGANWGHRSNSPGYKDQGNVALATETVSGTRLSSHQRRI